MHGNRTRIGTVLFFLLLILGGTETMNGEAKETYPSKPITVIIAYTPGASLDFTTRALATYLSKDLGTNIIISNIPGAGGDIGHLKAYTSKPDGYTLLAWNTLSPLLSEYMHEVKYKTMNFTPVAAIAHEYHVLLGHPEGFTNVKDLIKESQNRTITISNNGKFTINGFQARLMVHELGMKVSWVNYGGGADAITALAGKHVEAATTSIAASMALIKAGKIVPLLVFAKKRVPSLPNVPVPDELGYDFPLLGGSTLGIVGPPGMDKEKVRILESGIMKTTKSPPYVAWFDKASSAERIFLGAGAYGKELERLGQIAARFKSTFAKD